MSTAHHTPAFASLLADATNAGYTLTQVGTCYTLRKKATWANIYFDINLLTGRGVLVGADVNGATLPSYTKIRKALGI